MVKVSNWKRLGIGALALTLIIILGSIWRSCEEASERRISELQGRYNALEAEKAQEKQNSERVIKEKEKTISDLNDQIENKNVEILELNQANLEIPTVEIITIPPPDMTWEESSKQNAQAAEEWKAKYFEAREIIEWLGPPQLSFALPGGVPVFIYPEGSLTWNLDQRFLAQVEISNQFRIQRDGAESLLRISNDLNVEKDKKIRSMKFKFTLKTLIYNAASFGLGYVLGGD